MTKMQLYRPYWSQANQDGIDYYVSGWADFEGVVIDNKNLIKTIIENHLYDFDVFNRFVSNLNGNFSIIVSTPAEAFIGADKMRGYPVIYFKHNGEWIITDDIIQFRKLNAINLVVDDLICEQYLCSDFVFGPHTIFKEVFSIQAGETVVLNQNLLTATRKQYFQWTPNMSNSSGMDFETEAKKQDEIFISIFKRMIKSAPNIHNWIIPLSGGYDSRTIANYLYKLGIRNVICYSYGAKDNLEAKISKQVAEALGYQWYFIDYSEWTIKLQQTNLITNYLDYGFNGSSVAHLQDFTAVFALNSLGIVKQGDVFVPGHALEVLAGSHLNIKSPNCKTIEDAIITVNRHFSGFGYYTKKRKPIIKMVKQILDDYGIDPQQMAECFDWKERQSKFIANSVKTYEYFNLDWRIPEWDAELFRYWSEISFNYRYNRNMYKDVFKKHLAVDAIKNISFANDLIEKQKENISVKSAIINKLPVWIKRFIKNIGWFKQTTILREGYNMIFADHTESIEDYIFSFSMPKNIKRYLKAYPKKQLLTTLNVNSIITLLNIKSLYK